MLGEYTRAQSRGHSLDSPTDLVRAEPDSICARSELARGRRIRDAVVVVFYSVRSEIVLGYIRFGGKKKSGRKSLNDKTVFVSV